MSAPALLGELFDLLPDPESPRVAEDLAAWRRALDAVLPIVYPTLRAVATAPPPVDEPAPGPPPPAPSPEVGGRPTCEVCGRSFASPQALGGHRRAHRNAQPGPPTPTATWSQATLEDYAERIKTRPSGVRPHEAIMRATTLTEAKARQAVIACRDAGLLPRAADLAASAGPIGRTDFDPDKARQRAAESL